MNKWTQEQIEILKLHYPKQGAIFCAQLLDLPKTSIYNKANRLGLTYSKYRMTDEEYINKVIDLALDIYPIETYKNNKTKIKHECLKGHIWNSLPSNILAGHGCPICAGKGSKTHEQYIQQLKEASIEYIPLEKYTRALDAILHKCNTCEYEWKVSPTSILNNKTGCPKCSKTGFNPAKPAKFYYIKIGRYYKVGITNKDIIKRFGGDLDKSIKIILIEEYENGTDALKREREILNTFETCYAGQYLKSGGNTELFDWDILQLDKE